MIEFTNNVQEKNTKKLVPQKTVHPCLSPMFMVYHTFFFSSCQNWGGKFTIFVPNCDQTLNHLNPKSDPSVFCCLWDAYGDITRLHTCILSSDLSFKKKWVMSILISEAQTIYFSTCASNVVAEIISVATKLSLGSHLAMDPLQDQQISHKMGWFQIPPWKKKTQNVGCHPFCKQTCLAWKIDGWIFHSYKPPFSSGNSKQRCLMTEGSSCS